MPLSPVVIDGARVTVSLVSVYVGSIFYQMYAKIRAAAAVRKARVKGDNKPFNRYASEDKRLLIADRIVGNLLEWMVPFLALFWLSVTLTGRGVEAGWVYVVSRVLYPFLAANGGLSHGGARPLIFLATVPGYGVLSYLTYQIFPLLLESKLIV